MLLAACELESNLEIFKIRVVQIITFHEICLHHVIGGLSWAFNLSVEINRSFDHILTYLGLITD